MYEGVNMDELEILDQVDDTEVEGAEEVEEEEAEVPAIDEELADEIGL